MQTWTGGARPVPELAPGYEKLASRVGWAPLRSGALALAGRSPFGASEGVPSDGEDQLHGDPGVDREAHQPLRVGA